MSTLDERVWQLRNGIIQRLNNPEGLQGEEVDTLISAVQEQERERIRNGSKYDDYHDDKRWCGRPDGDPAKAFWTVPVSVLARGEG